MACHFDTSLVCSMAVSSPSSSRSQSSVSSLQPFSTTSIPRLQALYSDFSRQKHSNPTSYNANVEWWRNALEALVGSGMQHSPYTNTPTPQYRIRNARLDDSDSDGDGELLRSEQLVLHGGRELLEGLKIPKVGKPLALGAVLVRHSLPCPLSHSPALFTICRRLPLFTYDCCFLLNVGN